MAVRDIIQADVGGRGRSLLRDELNGALTTLCNAHFKGNNNAMLSSQDVTEIAHDRLAKLFPDRSDADMSTLRAQIMEQISPPRAAMRAGRC